MTKYSLQSDPLSAGIQVPSLMNGAAKKKKPKKKKVPKKREPKMTGKEFLAQYGIMWCSEVPLDEAKEILASLSRIGVR